MERRNIKISSNRLSGWQLESFKKSYANKILTGKSLIREQKFKE
jgi:hypothetical protein